MSVTVDYLVVYSGESDLVELLTEMLKNELEGVGNEPPEEELKQSIEISYTKMRENDSQIYGFSVKFDSAWVEINGPENNMGELINNFSKSILDCTKQGIKRLLKLNDPQLRFTLRDYGDQIFEIEMKLREVLSLIFVDTYGDENFYSLLKETKATPSSQPETEQMRKYYENQFFFLLFSDYKQINNRKSLDPNTVFNYIRQADDFEGLKQMITTTPIKKEQYTSFLASLRDRVGPIEELRNCVAHNRSIPEEIIENYKIAREQLFEEIDKFLNQQANREEEL